LSRGRRRDVTAMRWVLPVALLAISVGACGGSSTSPPATTSPLTTIQGSTTTNTSAPSPVAAANWTTYDQDAGRSGVDRTSPPVGSVLPAWTSVALDGKVYAQPLVVGSTVFVATEDDTVYALDAATGTVRWLRHLASPVSGSSLPCGNIDPSGITGTPVIDPTTGRLWVVTFSPPFVHTLWSLDLATGAVISSRNADPPGADARAEQERGALVLDGSEVYIPYGGLYGDCSDYHGWVVGMSSADTTSTTKATWETQSARTGIWAPPGPVVASDGSILVATGNGLPVDEIGGSDSVVRLSPALAVESSFTPVNYAQLSADDLDLDSTSPALVEGLVFQIGKQGVGYLLASTDLGGVGGQLASGQLCRGGFGGTAVDGALVFVSCFDGLYAIRVTPATGGRPPGLSVAWSATDSRTGPPIVAGGDVWVVDTNGVLVARAEATGAEEYHHSISVAGSFPSPAAGGGRLFAPDGNRVAAYSGV
jgi:outer membrane protein assembly factor BamB